MACEILTDVGAGRGKLLPWMTGALRRGPCASHRKARWRVPARWIQGTPTDRPPRRVGVLGARRRPSSLLPRTAMNRHSQPEKTNPDAVQIDTAQNPDTAQLFYRTRDRALR